MPLRFESVDFQLLCLHCIIKVLFCQVFFLRFGVLAGAGVSWASHHFFVGNRNSCVICLLAGVSDSTSDAFLTYSASEVHSCVEVACTHAYDLAFFFLRD